MEFISNNVWLYSSRQAVISWYQHWIFCPPTYWEIWFYTKISRLPPIPPCILLINFTMFSHYREIFIVLIIFQVFTKGFTWWYFELCHAKNLWMINNIVPHIDEKNNAFTDICNSMGDVLLAPITFPVILKAMWE